ncbi:vWA domain-containing protein [Paucihalobacter sp.]|uniref:vWA domain-containing protein n=1 Tax=Paucihalobacter sp. TaxID=2850405 RepID=UPI002FE3D5D8
MTNLTVVYIILSIVLALLIALFQYKLGSKLNKNLSTTLAVLRFVTVFTLLLLLINPKFENLNYYYEKPNLVIAVDNSESIAFLNQTDKAQQTLNTLKSNTELNKRFNIETFQFDAELIKLDSLNFSSGQSNISKAIGNLHDIYRESNAAFVFLTDGNQTYGTDYQYISAIKKQPIYPIVLGDTIQYNDLKIQQLNVNRYAFLKNRFPVEVIAVYEGKETVNSQIKITSGNATIFSENVQFSPENSSKVINTTMLAETVGLKTYKVEVVPMVEEKNITNNVKNFAVEVVDEKSNVAIVSEIVHPDLGMLKKSIETNEQRSATILNNQDAITKIDEFQLFILYQPNNSFKPLFEILSRLDQNMFIIGGKQTDWRALNSLQNYFTQTITNQYENYQTTLNPGYGNFIVDDLDFNAFPPLQSEFGECVFNVPHDVLLYKVINGFETEEALLATLEINTKRAAVLLGEDIWKWRAQSYLDQQSFVEFDNFVGKLVQYLSSNKQRTRLNIDFQTFYNGSDNIIITVQFFNKNYEFESNAQLNISLKNQETGEEINYPLLLNGNKYEVDLNSLPSGDFDFTITESNENISKSGSIKILDYNVEAQLLNPNFSKLQSIAQQSGGKSYFIDTVDALIFDLLSDSRYKTVQKSSKNIVPLLDFKFLLALLALALGLEWFIRKYNGLI